MKVLIGITISLLCFHSICFSTSVEEYNEMVDILYGKGNVINLTNFPPVFIKKEKVKRKTSIVFDDEPFSLSECLFLSRRKELSKKKTKRHFKNHHKK